MVQGLIDFFFESLPAKTLFHANSWRVHFPSVTIAICRRKIPPGTETLELSTRFATAPNGDRKIVHMGLHITDVCDDGLYKYMDVDEVEKEKVVGEGQWWC